MANLDKITDSFEYTFFAKEGFKAVPSNAFDNNGKKKVKFNYSALGRPINKKDYYYHLTTDIGLTPSPIINSSKCLWGAIDDDRYDLSPSEKVSLINRAIELKLTPSYTKSGGIHFWCVAKDEVSCSAMRGYLRYCRDQLGLPQNIEIFPKQNKVEQKGIGNGITLPYRNYIRNNNCPKGIAIVNGSIVTLTVDQFIHNIGKSEIPAEHFNRYDTEDLKEDLPGADTDYAEGSAQDPSIKKLTSSEIYKKIQDEKMSLTDDESFFDDLVTLYIGKRVGNFDTDEDILNSLTNLKDTGADIDYYKSKIRRSRDTTGIEDPFKARQKMLEDVVYIKQRDKYFDLRTNQEYKESAVNFEYQRLFKKKTPVAFIKSNPKRKSVEDWIYDPKVYDPNNPIIKIDNLNYLNAYQPGTLKPEEGDISLWLKLLDHIFNGDKDNINIFLDWLAFQLQNPGEKIRWAIIIVTTNFQTGKGSIWRTIKEMFGINNAKEIDVGQALDKSKGYLTNSQLVLIDEMQSVGTFGERQELLNQLKRIITEDYISSRQLYVDYKIIKSVTNYLLFSNHKDALSLPANEKRYWPIINEKPRLKDDFYEKYHAWIDEGGAKAVLHNLLNRDITDDFKPKGVAPDSVFLNTMSSAGEHPLTRTIRTYFDELEFPFTEDRIVIGSRELFEWLQHHKLLGRAKINDVANALETIGGKNLGQVRVEVQGKVKRPTLYLIRNHDEHHGKQYQELSKLWWPLHKEDGGSNN